jgi:nicotinate dehydrogenase subunit B
MTRPLSVSFKANPSLDAWIRIETDGSVTVFTGKVEIGQGIKTALALIAAEELDVAMERIRVVMADTAQSPNELYTASSQSVEDSGGAIRQAAAEARFHLLSKACEVLGMARDELHVVDGVVRGPSCEVTYAQLMGGRRFDCMVTGAADPKRPHQYRWVGKPARRVDLADKVFGKPVFVQDLTLPGMVYGRVLRPPSQHATLVSLDVRDVEHMPGVVKVVVDGSFVGVVARREYQAISAVQALRARASWQEPARLPAADQMESYLRSNVTNRVAVVGGVASEDTVIGEASHPDGHRLFQRTYLRSHLMHGSLGPSAAVAQYDSQGLTVWTHNQGVHLLRGALAEILHLAVEQVRVLHVEGAGSYGHNAAEDAACDAALLARAVAPQPVSLQWSREDEHTWEPYGPAMVVDVAATLDAQGYISSWNHEVWSTTHVARAVPLGGASGFVAAWHLKEPRARPTARPWTGAPHLGGHRNAEPLYTFPSKRVVEHFVAETPLRTSTLRSLGAYPNVLAIESLMDELAGHAGVDAVEFRLRHLHDERAASVLRRLAEECSWAERAGWESGLGRGRGLALAQYKNAKTYAGVAVDLSLDEQTCEIRLHEAVIVADAGLIIDPDGLTQQLEGGFIQSASWTLKERVTFDDTRVTSVDWLSYPILRFREVPAIRTVLLNRPDSPSVGAGEAAQGPTAAAIANALAQACGLRLCAPPFTAERVRNALLA